MNWTAHLSTITFAYNATPHLSTKFQPYELMFGQKAPAPCDAWLGLHAYNDTKSSSKLSSVAQQLEHMLTTNMHALKQIKARIKKNPDRVREKDLLIPRDNLVLLKDHPESWNKIQDMNKSTLFVITGLHKNLNAYYIKPIDCKSSAKLVNRRGLHDLGIIKEKEEKNRDETFSTEDDSVPPVPVFALKQTKSLNQKLMKQNTNIYFTHWVQLQMPKWPL